jgi:hypothetical protein
MKILKSPHFTWNTVMLCGLFFIAALLRLRLNFSSILPPSVDGIYYPLQVRSLIENGHLAFHDMPFTFWLEAAVAKLILLFSPLESEVTLMFTCRLIDSLVPPLLIIPVYLLFKRIAPKRPAVFLSLIVCGFAILNPSISVLLVTDFHKNAIGLLLLFLFCHGLFSFIQSKEKSTLAFTALCFILVGLTHIGCFATLLLFITIIAIIYHKNIFGSIRGIFGSKRYAALLAICAGITIIIALIFIAGDADRLHKLLSVSTTNRLFRNSLFIQVINHRTELEGIRLIYFIFNTLCSIFGIITFFATRKQLSANMQKLLGATVLWHLALISPLIGMEWAERFYFISFVPFTIILIFAFGYLKKSGKIITATVISLFLCLAVATAPTKKISVLSENEYHTLRSMKKFINTNEKIVVVAKHGLEWWATWSLECDSRSTPISGQKAKQYATIFYLQTTQQTPRPNNGIADIQIPKQAILIAGNQYFNLYAVYPAKETAWLE